MKCPKCHYLGFETGDRCRNCGYDFSLIATPPARDAGARPDAGLVAVPGVNENEESLPLFADPGDEEPLITVPSAPRPPVAVRRAPDTPRAKPAALVHLRERTAARRTTPQPDEPRLEFPPPSEADPVPAPPAASAAPSVRSRTIIRGATRPPAPAPSVTPARTPQARPEPCAPGARAQAAAVDLAILAAIDLLVIYFTLRMAGLTGSEWRLLPPVPLTLFLMMLKLAYFAAFTAVGGQTIGKMAARIRVVGDEGPMVAPSRALHRTVVAGAALLTLGGTFIPALLGRERLAVHDRLAQTRVVALPPA